jgi:uncharacterized protein (TIGR00725 family)
MPPLFISKDRQTLHDGSRRFDTRKLAWVALDTPVSDSEAVTPVEAIRWLYAEANARLVPVGVIGPREATQQQAAVAEQLGRQLGELGIPLLNGGKNGVMEAVSKGCAEAGGLILGFIPEDDWTTANDYVTIPIATGIGKARNVLIAQSSLALIAVGGGYGTMSEMAFGLHFDKPVFALSGAPKIEGAHQMESVEDVVDALISVILRLSY